jgi:hypothetical protein
MLQNYANGYYLDHFTPLSHNGDDVMLDTIEYNALQQVANTEPVVLKIGNSHIPVVPSSGIPAEHMAVPSYLFPVFDLREGESHRVLVAKRNTVKLLVQMAILDGYNVVY